MFARRPPVAANADGINLTAHYEHECGPLKCCFGAMHALKTMCRRGMMCRYGMISCACAHAVWAIVPRRLGVGERSR